MATLNLALEPGTAGMRGNFLVGFFGREMDWKMGNGGFLCARGASNGFQDGL